MQKKTDMSLTCFKPDWAEAKMRWQAFWQGEMLDRPPIIVTASRKPGLHVPTRTSLEAITEDFASIADRMLEIAMATYYGGDAFPYYVPTFGPDQFAAFIGCKLRWSPDSPDTNWIDPFVANWDSDIPFHYETNYWWQRMQEFCAILAEKADGRVLIAHLDSSP